MYAIIRFTEGLEAKLLDDARTWECDDPEIKEILEDATLHVADCGPAFGPTPWHENYFHELAQGVAQHVGAELVHVEEPESFEFNVWVESPLAKPEFVQLVQSLFPERKENRPDFFVSEGSSIEVIKSKLSDSTKIDDPEDGFWHMRYKIECIPDTDETDTEEHQMALAKRLLDKMKSSGYRTALRAPFRDKL
jgi:hypothetical protein